MENTENSNIETKLEDNTENAIIETKIEENIEYVIEAISEQNKENMIENTNLEEIIETLIDHDKLEKIVESSNDDPNLEEVTNSPKFKFKIDEITEDTIVNTIHKETTDYILVNTKLDEFFENLLLSFERKLPNDYEILREFSNQYTAMYHEICDIIIPEIKELNEKDSPIRQIETNPNSLQGKKLSRSKTPVKLVTIKPSKEEPAEKLNKIKTTNKIPTRELTTPTNRDKSKGPILKNKDLIIKKKNDSLSNFNKSTNNLTSIKDSKKIDLKKEFNNVKKIEPKPKNKLKRDLTPNPTSKKNNVLDLSSDSIAPLKNKKDVKENNKSSTKKVLPTPTNKKSVGDNNKDKKNGQILESKFFNDPGKNKNLIEESPIKEDVVNNAIDTIQPANIEGIKVNNNANKELPKDRANTRFNKNKGDVIYSSKYIKCLSILCNYNHIPLVQRYKIITASKELNQKIGLRKILKEKIYQVDRELEKLSNDHLFKCAVDPNIVETFLSKNFAPSKTAQNGLNFVTKEEENNLCKKEQSPEILNIFRLIYILVNENYEEIEPQKLIQNLTTVVFEKLGVENFKSLFISCLSKNTDFSSEQYDKISNIVQENPKILNPQELLKINRSVSYMTFILKEIYDYIFAKTPEGEPIFSIRKLHKRLTYLNQIKSELETLNENLPK